jgi:hypothetical protein
MDGCDDRTESVPLLVTAVSVLGAFFMAVVQASFFEWVFHRYWLHRPWLPKHCFTTHTLVHHQLCKYDDTFHIHEKEQEEALHFNWWGGPLLLLINLAPWGLVCWALARAGLDLPYAAMLVTFGATFGLYYAGYETFHYLMHKPTMPLIERSSYFQFLKRHHRIHHARMDRNLNVLVPVADWMLGTLVTETSVIPSRTPESARTLARRHSRRKPAKAGSR